MSNSAPGQLQIQGNGYTGAIALNATAMYIYHNSSLRDLVLGTNETARLTIDGSNGNATFVEGVFTGDVNIQGDLTVNGTYTQIDTDVSTTEQWLVTNDGTGPAAIINQIGAQDIIDIQDDGTSVFYIEDGGNVGIGTTDPAAKLDVAGSVYVHSGDGLYTNDFRAYSGSDITFHNTGNTTFAGSVIAGGGTQQGASGSVLKLSTSSGNTRVSVTSEATSILDFGNQADFDNGGYFIR